MSCVDLGNGHHYSHSRLCNLTSTQTSPVHPLLNSLAITSTENSAWHSTMARIHHRMRSRRGGSWGGSIRPPETPSHDSVSPSPSPKIPYPHSSVSGRYPDTCSGWGRAQLPRVCRRDVIVHKANFPLPPHPAPQSTQFFFCISLNRPVISATITIVFSDETEPQDASSGSTGAQQQVARRLRNERDSGKHAMDEEMDTLHGKALGGGLHTARGSSRDTCPPGGSTVAALGLHAAVGSSSGFQAACGKHSGMSEEEDDWYQYASLIKEEPTPDELK